jgi:glucose-induced degradation protein 8
VENHTFEILNCPLASRSLEMHLHNPFSNLANISPSDINALILDYLTMAGYPKAAANFSKEANLQPQQDDSAIRARQEIQHAIHTGNIENAISALNELDPEVLARLAYTPFTVRCYD